MKTNPWIIVSLMAMVCGFLLGSRVENEAEAEAPKYQYYYNPDGELPVARYAMDRLESEQYFETRPMYVRVNLSTGEYEELIFTIVKNLEGESEEILRWKECKKSSTKYRK